MALGGSRHAGKRCIDILKDCSGCRQWGREEDVRRRPDGGSRRSHERGGWTGVSGRQNNGL